MAEHKTKQNSLGRGMGEETCRQAILKPGLIICQTCSSPLWALQSSPVTPGTEDISHPSVLWWELAETWERSSVCVGLSVLTPPVPLRVLAQPAVTQLDLCGYIKLNISLRATWKEMLMAYITLTHSSSKQGNTSKF